MEATKPLPEHGKDSALGCAHLWETKGIKCDLLGPTMVKAMVNTRAHLKVWPIVFVCQATGALHIQVAHD